MKKCIFNKKIIIACLIIVFIIGFLIYFNNNDKYEFEDSVKYDGKVYGLLEYKTDIFVYNYNSNEYLEEEVIHKIKSDKWNAVYLDGDLFILDKQVSDAIKYYSDDNNYEWFILFDSDENNEKNAVSFSKDELDYLYNIEKMEKKDTISFDEIDEFADIIKVSNDGLVQGIITLVSKDGVWYYKTEIMDDNDREYVIKLSESLQNKLNES